MKKTASIGRHFTHRLIAGIKPPDLEVPGYLVNHYTTRTRGKKASLARVPGITSILLKEL